MPKLALLLSGTLVAGFLGLPHQASAGVVSEYPSGSAPCDTTLQACIDAASVGATIEIITENRIDEDITIAKSLTLRSADGVRGWIGGSGGDDRAAIFVQEPDGGQETDVVLDGLRLDKAELDVDFDEGTSHSFVLRDSTLVNNIDHNNQDGIGLEIHAPSTVALLNNTIRTTGEGVQLAMSLPIGSIDLVNVDIARNRITKTIGDQSAGGIEATMSRGGYHVVDVYSNVFHGLGGCACGAEAGIWIDAGHSGVPNETMEGTANVVANTIDDIEGGVDGLLVSQPDADVDLSANMFNNTISRASGRGIALPPVSPQLVVKNGYNNFHDNANPKDFGGYDAGPSTLGENPQFRDPSSADYRLRSVSPLVDRGTNCSEGGTPRLDRAGNDRIHAARIDIGAFEFGSPGPPGPGVSRTGTAGTDSLGGTDGRDILCGLAGQDDLQGAGGRDILDGGPGRDTAGGGGGNDRVTGGKADDSLRGGDGEDVVDARDGSGGDQAFGGPGSDVCRLDEGDTSHSCSAA